MTDTTAICFGQVNLGDRCYIGPYCVLGFPAECECSIGCRAEDGNLRTPSRGVTIGNETQLMSHVVVGEGTVLRDQVWCDHHTYIGCDTKVGEGAQILYGAKIYHRASIGKSAWVAGFLCNDVIIEDGAVVLGQLVHKFKNASVGVPEKSPIVRKSAFVGMNALIIGGIEVGSGAYIAGGAVLTHSAKPGRLYAGVPAREMGPAPAAFNASK